MLAGSKCPKCQAGIEKFVGMQRPIPVISKNTGNVLPTVGFRCESCSRSLADYFYG
jgi:hypothetical protein